jgi:hypothetical protein
MLAPNKTLYRVITIRVRHAPILLILLTSASSNGATLFDRSAYQSFSDSPFIARDDGTSLFLEDFEDGELNTPGIVQTLGSMAQAVVLQPGSFTDSVDGDDGAVDGSGNSGRSLRSTLYTFQPTDPVVSTSYMAFGFSQHELGFLPNAFGLVWTDGFSKLGDTYGGNRLRIELLNRDRDLIFRADFYSFGDNERTGQTMEDRFVGVAGIDGIAYADVFYTYISTGDSLEIDHLQYGRLAVPEPSSVTSWSACALVFICVIQQVNRKRSGAYVLLKRLHRDRDYWKAETQLMGHGRAREKLHRVETEIDSRKSEASSPD